MEFKRHDIIEIKRGLRITAEVPSCYFTSNLLFSDEKSAHEFDVGTILQSPSKFADLEKIKEKMKSDLVRSLEQYGLTAENYRENIENYIAGLNLKFKERNLDTSIYEGRYKVYYVGREADEVWVYCEKIGCINADKSAIEIKFRLSAAQAKRDAIVKLN